MTFLELAREKLLGEKILQIYSDVSRPTGVNHYLFKIICVSGSQNQVSFYDVYDGRIHNLHLITRGVNNRCWGAKIHCHRVPKQSKQDVTFPRATADVAMSRTKLSPSLPGAATLRGLVPKVHWKEQVQSSETWQRSGLARRDDGGYSDLPVYHEWEPPVGMCWWMTCPAGGSDYGIHD